MGTPSQPCAEGDHAAGDPARAQEHTRRAKPISEWWEGRRVHGVGQLGDHVSPSLVWVHSACEPGSLAWQHRPRKRLFCGPVARL